MNTEQRLAQVELQLRWLKRLGALAIAVGAVVVLVGQGGANGKVELGLPNLKAKSLHVLDVAGNHLAMLPPSGHFGLLIGDDSGQDFEGRIFLGLMDARTANQKLHRTANLMLHDKTGLLSCLLEVGDDGSPYFMFRDKKGRERMELLLRADGAPSLIFKDKDGKVIWKAPGE
ncbi:MAG: hypothetical protein ACYSX0_22350 [Planctomycetota bacterium]|jgi:hypothetical protein